MLITDFFQELNGNIPYINRFDDLFCTHEQRIKVKCTEEFTEKGYLKNSVRDIGAEYKDKCHACRYFKHNMGFYFGKEQYSNNFEEKSCFYLNLKTGQELAEVVKHMPYAKSIFLETGRGFDFSPIAELTNLESAQLFLGSRDILWDLKKTPGLRVLEIGMGISSPTLDKLIDAHSLEYLSLMPLVSQTSLTVLPTLNFLSGMTNLKGLILSGVTNNERSVKDILSLPALERIWLSPNLFPTEEYARFEALKFKIGEEYGIFKNDDYICPYGIGKREFRSEKAKEKFLSDYYELMAKVDKK